MSVVDERPPSVAVKPACEAVGASRATWYRRRSAAAAPAVEKAPRKPHPRRIPDAERDRIAETLCSEAFVDETPRIVHARLLDEGRFLCSPRTMYRILAERGAARARRAERRHRRHAPPQLVATAPGQVWTWDSTKLPSFPGHVCLYVAIDLYSRHVVGWTISHTESAIAARNFLDDAIRREGVAPQRLTVHSDRGTPMTSRSMARLLADLGVRKSHSRPRVSDDNPYSESQFKTLKHGPIWPHRRLGIHEWARWCRDAFEWYANRPHEGIAFFTPAQVHRGEHRRLAAIRQRALDEAYRRYPERFVRGRPRAAMPPAEVWINPPKDRVEPHATPETDASQANAARTGRRTKATPDRRQPSSPDDTQRIDPHDPRIRFSGGMRVREHSDAQPFDEPPGATDRHGTPRKAGATSLVTTTTPPKPPRRA